MNKCGVWVVSIGARGFCKLFDSELERANLLKVWLEATSRAHDAWPGASCELLPAVYQWPTRCSERCGWIAVL
jgi:hypothetical protein